MSSQQEHIDEFESLFRRAEREPFGYGDIPLKTVAVVTDGGGHPGAIRVGRATLMRRLHGALSSRVLFDASVPLLPGFDIERGFVF